MGSTVSVSGNSIQEVLDQLKEQVNLIFPHMQPDGDATVHNKETNEAHLYQVILKNDPQAPVTGSQIRDGGRIWIWSKPGSTCPYCNHVLTVENHQHCDPNLPAFCPDCKKLVNFPEEMGVELEVELKEIPIDTPINSATSCSIAVTKMYHKDERPWEGCLHFE